MRRLKIAQTMVDVEAAARCMLLGCELAPRYSPAFCSDPSDQLVVPKSAIDGQTLGLN